ncbi:MAG: ABC transporter permease, putative arabinogalactan oligomer transport system permease protein [Chloroflexi bacterium CSP1-4]|nr:MAG: ABC transporter permease, putative arabinogalactan oligomer transport system permease protein [Chloroflexi bacterium CSP1-4]
MSAIEAGTLSIRGRLGRAVAAAGRGGRGRLSLPKQALAQATALFLLFTVLFPILWVFALSLDPLNRSRPEGLSLIPANATLEAYAQVLSQPTNNPISFLELTANSLKIAFSSSIFSVLIGVSAAYAFSRLRFTGREVLMLAILGVLMLPSVATLAPLFVMLNKIQVSLPFLGEFNLRNSLMGVSLAIISGLLPFAIWNLKGYLDTIPHDLEEAAAVDGASTNQTFLRIILPLAMPALAVTAFLGFVAGWTEFYFSWMFLENPSDQTLAMAIYAMQGQFSSTPWSLFSAFAILFAFPPAVVYFFAQRYIISGLAIGAVKG